MPQPPTSESASPTDTAAETTPEASEPPSPPSNPSGNSADEPEPSSGQLPAGSPRSQAAPIPGVELSFTLDTPDTDPPAAGWLETQLAEAIRLSGVTTGSLSVTLIDDPTMIALHAEHCDDPTPTDVLTFDLAPPEADRSGPVTHIDGDLVICRDEAQRQATARGHDTRVELLLYVVHGLMHLLGEDDHDDQDYKRMHQREDRLLTQMGLGPVFHRDASPGNEGEAI